MADFGGTPLGSAFLEIGGDLSRLTKDFARAKGLTTSATSEMTKKAQVKMRMDTKGFTAALGRVKTQLSSGLKTMGDAIQKHSEAIRGVGMGMTVMGGAVSAAMGLAVKTTGGFQQAMANVQSVASATSEELGKLTGYARVMGKESVFSASQAADAMYYLASAGMKTDDIMGSLSGTLKLAAATQSDLAFTTSTVASTLSAYQMDAVEATRISNVFAAAISGSQATMEKLAGSMAYVAPVAHSLNMSLEQTTAMMTQLYNAGFEASMVGTALRAGMSKLLNPTAEVTETMGRLNVALTDSAGKTRPFIEIIRDLHSAGMEAADALAIFGDRAGPAMIALVSKGAESIEAMTRQITGTDKASEMAAMQINTFQGNLKLLKSATEELQISIGTRLLPLLTDTVKHITSVTNAMSKWTEAHPALTGAMAKMAMVLGPMVAAGGAFAILVPTLANIAKGMVALRSAIYLHALPGIWKLGAAFAAFATNPAVMAAAAVVGISIALAEYYKRANDAKRITEDLEKAVENLPALSQIRIDVLIEEAEGKLRRFQKQYWDLIAAQKAYLRIFEEEAGTGLSKISYANVRNSLSEIADKLEDVKTNYNTTDQALRKLLETQGKYNYAATSVSAEVLESTQKEFRAILLKIQGLKDEEQQYDNLLTKASKWTNPAMIKRWEKGLADARSELVLAKAEYDDIDKRLMGMYKSMSNAGKATQETAKAVTEASKVWLPFIEGATEAAAVQQAFVTALQDTQQAQAVQEQLLSIWSTQLSKISAFAGEQIDKGIQEYLKTPKFPRTLQEVTQQAIRDLKVTGIEAEPVAMPKVDTSELESRIKETTIFLQEAMGTGWDELSDREKEYWQFRVKLAEGKTTILKDVQLEYIRWQAEKYKSQLSGLSSNLQTFVDTFEWPKPDPEPLSEYGNIARDVARSTQYAFTDLFATMIDPSVKPAWAQFWDDLKSIAINAIAEIVVKMAALKWTGAGLPGAEAMLGGAMGALGTAAGTIGIGGTLAVGAGVIAGGFGLYKLFDALLNKEDKADNIRNRMAGSLEQIAAKSDELNKSIDDAGQAIYSATQDSARSIIDAIFSSQRGERPSVPRVPAIPGEATADEQLSRLERLQASRPGRARTITQYQSGGIVDKPTYALIAEAGKEAVVPMSSGKIPLEYDAQLKSAFVPLPGGERIPVGYDFAGLPESPEMSALKQMIDVGFGSDIPKPEMSNIQQIISAAYGKIGAPRLPRVAIGADMPELKMPELGKLSSSIKYSADTESIPKSSMEKQEIPVSYSEPMKPFLSGLQQVINARYGEMTELGMSKPGTVKIPVELLAPEIPDLKSLSSIQKFQYGGIVTRPQVAMVGESGPEAIVPLRRGTAERQIQPQIIQPNVTMSPGSVQITEEFPNVRMDTMTMDRRMRMYEKTLRPAIEEWVQRGMFQSARR